MALAPDDPRPSTVLYLLGTGLSLNRSAQGAGINRRTLNRWRGCERFGAAIEIVLQQREHLHGDDPVLAASAREQIEAVLATWSPGGLAGLADRLRLPSSQPVDPPAHEPVPPPVPSAPEREVIAADVLDDRGRTISPERPQVEPARLARPYLTRPPTIDEWKAELAAMAIDPATPPTVRRGSIAALTMALMSEAGPARRRGAAERPDDDQPLPRRERDRGMSAAAWAEVDERVLGPEPVGSADVVELHRAESEG